METLQTHEKDAFMSVFGHQRWPRPICAWFVASSVVDIIRDSQKNRTTTREMNGMMVGAFQMLRRSHINPAALDTVKAIFPKLEPLRRYNGPDQFNYAAFSGRKINKEVARKIYQDCGLQRETPGKQDWILEPRSDYYRIHTILLKETLNSALEKNLGSAWLHHTFFI